MPNFVTVCFKPCEPTPANGYVVKYRLADSGAALRTWPVNFFSSPAQLLITEDPDGLQYEGYIYGDCGDGQLGVGDAWKTGDNPPESTSEGSPSASSSDSTPVPPPGIGTIRVDPCILDGTITEVRWNNFDVLNVDGDFPVDPGEEITVTVPASGTHTLRVFVNNGGKVTVVDSLGNVQCQDAPGFGTLTFTGFTIVLGTAWSVTMDCGTCD